MNSGRGCRDVKPVSNVNAYRMEKEKAERREVSKREREKVMVQGFVAVHGIPGRQDRCFLSAREPLSNESLTGYAFVKAMNWKFSHFAF